MIKKDTFLSGISMINPFQVYSTKKCGVNFDME